MANWVIGFFSTFYIEIWMNNYWTFQSVPWVTAEMPSSGHCGVLGAAWSSYSQVLYVCDYPFSTPGWTTSGQCPVPASLALSGICFSWRTLNKLSSTSVFQNSVRKSLTLLTQGSPDICTANMCNWDIWKQIICVTTMNGCKHVY